MDKFIKGEKYQTKHDLGVRIDRRAYIIPGGKILTFVKTSNSKKNGFTFVKFIFSTEAGNLVTITDHAANEGIEKKG